MTNDVSASCTLPGNDGYALFCRAWRPAEAPVASIALVHGLGEHSGRYEHVGRYFAGKGYFVAAVDLRGHGRSEGQPGHVNRFQDYLNDVKTLIDYTREQSPAVPLFLLGHSMGGLIALVYALNYPDGLTSVIASAPGLRGRVHIPAWKAALGKAMSSLYPALSMPSGLDAAGVSRDPAVVQAYIADPLVHDKVTARWFTEFMEAGRRAMAEAHSLAAPALIVQGSEDQLVDPAASKEFFERISLDKKQYIEYEGLYHEVFNEPEKAAVLADVQAWLASFLSLPA